MIRSLPHADSQDVQSSFRIAFDLMRIGLLLFVLAVVPRSAAAQKTWEYSPYLIKVWVAFENHAELTDALLAQMAETISERSYSVAGATWAIETHACPKALRRDAVASIEDVTVDQVKSVAHPALKEDDKIFLLSVRSDLLGFQLCVRELDCRSRVWRPVVKRRCSHVTEIPGVTFDSVVTAFSPLVRIESGRGKELQVRIRAGGLVTDPSCPSHISDHDILLPIVRRNDRVGEPMENGIQIIPWTFLTIAERDGAILNCTVHSGMASALSGRANARTVKVALVAKPRYETTYLEVLSRDDPPRALSGYEAQAKDLETGEFEYIGATDWRGIIEIPKAAKPLRLIYLLNGGGRLARLPIVPGLESKLTIQLRDDDLRLEAEGFVKALQDRMLDLVVRRALYKSRFERALDDGNREKAREILNQIGALEKRSSLLRELDQAEQRLSSPDRYTQAKIDRLFQSTRELLIKFLDPQEFNTLSAKLGAG